MTRILVIDDNPELRAILETHLTKHGYEVVSAGDGDQGLAILEAGNVDIVLTDILMPRRDGVEVLRTVKKRWPTLPVIAISGGGWIGAQELLGMAERLGADQVLTKPLRRDDLLKAVDEALKNIAARKA